MNERETGVGFKDRNSPNRKGVPSFPEKKGGVG